MPTMTDTLTPAEREIVRYLLSDVTDEDRDRIGEKSVIDLEYGELVQTTELDLVEAYVRNRLSPNERLLFERNFLITDERKDRLEGMKMLVEYQQREMSRLRALRN
jgi:hypothetical protein